MDSLSKKILIVDDEEFNLDILDEYLKDAGFETVLATNGAEALERLSDNSKFDAIILDRMMPVMDGMQFMKNIKSSDKYRNIPVIMQTAAGTSEQILEGIAAGVFYYLTKPYEKTTLLTILNSALDQQIVQVKTSNELSSHKNSIKLLSSAKFEFRTLEQAKDLSFSIANIFPDPEKVVFGLNELTVNAIEHGNLGITFEEKKRLLSEGAWQNEIKNRLSVLPYSERIATLLYEDKNSHYELLIKDMGKGFDYKKFLEFDPKRLTDPNGRGIAMSRMYSFDDVQYLGNGNEVLCKILKA
jgi:CheY-like chemotaxis protein/anti-sigma regulatory factor (Ser/Thr protein kinase)